jgi:hypothetical protein
MTLIIVVGTSGLALVIVLGVANTLCGGMAGNVLAFAVQLGGAYSASFVIDMIRPSVAGELEPDAI